MSPAPQRLQPGVHVHNGTYRIVGPLSKGGMGIIYLAEDLGAFGRPCVIKEMLDYFDPANPQETQEARQRFEEEARTLAKLNHPRIPKLLSYFSEQQHNYIVMAYVEGVTLEHFVGQQPATAQVVGYGVQVCEILEYLGGLNPLVVHHDIKPANIIVDNATQSAWLVDFGVAKARLAMQQNGQVGVKKSSIFGTIGYAPPEQYLGQSESKSDVYALAATLYHVLTGDDPQNHPISFPQVTTLSAGVADALNAALEKDVQRRCTAPAFRQALERALRAPASNAPRLNVQPLLVDFGIVVFGQTQTPTRTIQVANDGISILNAGLRVSDPWLQTPTPAINVPGHGRESVTIQLNPRELAVRGQHTSELIVDAGGVDGVTVQIAVTVEGPFYPSIEPAPLDDVTALIAWSDKHWRPATQLLRRGELHAAARYLGEPARGGWSRRRAEPWTVVLRKLQQAAREPDANIGLEQALRALGAEPPTFVTNWREVERQLGLGLLPDLRWMAPWWQGPTQVVLRIKNTGRGYLYGQVVALVRWLAVDTPQFGCFAGQEVAIPIRVLKQQRKLSGIAPELLEVQVE
jgi:serine/threonine protein kinase